MISEALARGSDFEAGRQLHLNSIEVLYPVTLREETIGYVYVRAGLLQLYLDLLFSSLIFLAVIALGGIAAVRLSDRLQRRLVARSGLAVRSNWFLVSTEVVIGERERSDCRGRAFGGSY